MTAKVKTAQKSNTTTKKAATHTSVMAAYMDYVLEHGIRPASIYKFAKENGMQEAEFYKLFGSFDGLRQHVWIAFYQNTEKLLRKDKNFEGYGNQEKMLAFYFTMFEVLTVNRSYVLFALKENTSNMKNIAQLKRLRLHVKDFAADLVEQGNEQKSFGLTKNSVTIFSEGAWVQFLFLLKYWMDDNSAGFENTDVAIEKSVRVIFDVFETTPLESVLDFGKFLLKGQFSKA